MNNLPFITIIIPCLNEENYIGKCLDSVIANDYPKDSLEVLVVDGMSEDGTREIVGTYAKRYSFIRLLNNPKKIQASALNIGTKVSKGEVVMRMDAHCIYDAAYITRCLRALNEYNADNVGGIWRIIPRTDSLVGKAIVQSLSHKFGVGDAYYRFENSKKEPSWVDTVPFFCVRRECIQRVGPFNEQVGPTEDMEFNSRLRKAGGKILLVPNVISYYCARSDFKSFCRHNFRNGIWAIYPITFVNHIPVALRHLIPLAFVAGLIGSSVLHFFFPFFLWVFLLISASYLLMDLYFSSKIAFKKKDFQYLLLMPVVFASLHISYGLGSLWGLLKLIVSKQFWKNLLTTLACNNQHGNRKVQ